MFSKNLWKSVCLIRKNTKSYKDKFGILTDNINSLFHPSKNYIILNIILTMIC